MPITSSFTMGLDSDTRGWIMAAVSGVACIVGSCIVCVDLIVQLFPRGRNFRIQDSDAFLSASLSLSFGVMLFTSLYSLLPSSKKYFIMGGMSSSAAAYTLIGCFLGGVIGIQILSHLIHSHTSHMVVDCDHTHDSSDEEDHAHEHINNHVHHEPELCDEDTPLLHRPPECDSPSTVKQKHHDNEDISERKLSLPGKLTRQVSNIVTGRRPLCNGDGPCYGNTEPCSPECFKTRSRSPSRAMAARSIAGIMSHSPAFSRSALHSKTRMEDVIEDGLDEDSRNGAHNEERRSRPKSGHSDSRSRHAFWSSSYTNGNGAKTTSDVEQGHTSAKTPGSAMSYGHHHHIPANAFLAIGLQTSLAISIHKLPEGFITFATNHANPKLGFAVFTALFIHNITEGFAMALPLFLAFNSRARAIFWSALLGGVSQPLGAGIAALWLRTAGDHDMAPGERVYGAMFALTSGIMTSVALQLFAESLALTHNKGLCIAFAFVGMGVLGFSFALTA